LLLLQTKENFAKAEELLKKAIEVDPQLARAFTSLAIVYSVWAAHDWGPEDPTAFYQKAKTMAMKAIALDPADGGPHRILGVFYCLMGDFDRGIAEFEEAIVLSPNDPAALGLYGDWMTYMGRAKEGAEMVNRAFRLNPHYPDWYNYLVDPFYATGQYDEVIVRTLRRKGELQVWSQVLLAISYAQLNRRAEADETKAKLLRRYPEFSMERALSDFGVFKDQPTLDHYLEGARKAGLNECATEAELRKYPKMTHLALCDAKRAAN
jgi:adenylate cyclase